MSNNLSKNLIAMPAALNLIILIFYSFIFFYFKLIKYCFNKYIISLMIFIYNEICLYFDN